jgi:outer membrane protein OmpA-like peptidoglycan-associated protein
MRLPVRLAVLAALLTLGASGAAADPTGRYLYVAPVAGFTIFDGDIRFPQAALQDRTYLGGRLGYQWLEWLGLEAAGGVASTRENVVGGADVSFWHASGNAVFLPWRGVRGGPFLTAGFGLSQLESDDATALFNIAAMGPGQVKQGNLEIGGGLNLWATERWGLRLEARGLAWIGQDDIAQPLTHTIVTSAGLQYAFGARPRDTDGDGVPDRRDRCPGTPKGAIVDAAGCPSDGDRDGVLDGLDACSGTPKGCVIDARGCPLDADGDGVCDGLDTCPDTPKGATVDAGGCTSDGDGDGVLDGLDACPDTPAGCRIDASGCSLDEDKDGVCDGLDRCAGTTANLAVDSTGCPMSYIERETELLDTGRIRLENVEFETARADLRPESLPTLEAVGDLLVKWPDLRIEIGGHTDSRGGKKQNDVLSLARADSVRAYLLRRFPTLNPEQYVAKGYGFSRPIAPNTTEEGMQRNRRVEFVVLNQDVLIREIERRKQVERPAAPDSTQTPGESK